MHCAWCVMIMLGDAEPSGRFHGTQGSVHGSPLMCTLQPTSNLPLRASAWKRMQLPAPHLHAVQQGQSARHLPLCCP